MLHFNLFFDKAISRNKLAYLAWNDEKNNIFQGLGFIKNGTLLGRLATVLSSLILTCEPRILENAFVHWIAFVFLWFEIKYCVIIEIIFQTKNDYTKLLPSRKKGAKPSNQTDRGLWVGYRGCLSPPKLFSVTQNLNLVVHGVVGSWWIFPPPEFNPTIRHHQLRLDIKVIIHIDIDVSDGSCSWFCNLTWPAVRACVTPSQPLCKTVIVKWLTTTGWRICIFSSSILSLSPFPSRPVKIYRKAY